MTQAVAEHHLSRLLRGRGARQHGPETETWQTLARPTRSSDLSQVEQRCTGVHLCSGHLVRSNVRSLPLTITKPGAVTGLLVAECAYRITAAPRTAPQRWVVVRLPRVELKGPTDMAGSHDWFRAGWDRGMQWAAGGGRRKARKGCRQPPWLW